MHSSSESEALRSGVMLDGVFYAPCGGGIAKIDLNTGERSPVVSLPPAKKGAYKGDQYAHETDIIAHRNLLVTSCWNTKVQVFERSEGEWKSVKSILNASCPPYLNWEEPGHSFLVADEEKVARFVLGPPTKAKRQKSIKGPAPSLSHQLARRGDEVLVAGMDRRENLLVSVIDVSDRAALVAGPKQKLEQFVAKDVCSDEMRGLLVKDNFLFVSSYARRLVVYQGSRS